MTFDNYMTFDEFIEKWTGKHVDFDGIYPDQCMDLMHQYVYDVLGITDKTVLAAPSAYQAYTNNFPQYFDKIDNTPDGIPEKGDIVFFGQTIGQYGHVCIFISGDNNKFKSFDANWPIGSLPHVQDHIYNGVLGWFHPKGILQSIDSQIELDKMRADRDQNWGLYQDSLKTIGIKDARITELEGQVNEANGKITQLTSDNQTLTARVNDALDAAKKANEEDLQVHQVSLDQAHTIDSLNLQLKAIIAYLELSPNATTQDILDEIDKLKQPHDKDVKEITKVMSVFWENLGKSRLDFTKWLKQGINLLKAKLHL